MNDKTLAERLRDEMPATQSFQHSLLGDLLAEAADALDAKDAEIARLQGHMRQILDNAKVSPDVSERQRMALIHGIADAALRK